MSLCVRCGQRIGLFKAGGKIEEGQRFYDVKQDPATGEKSVALKEVSPYSSARAGSYCKLCWAKWETEQAEGRSLMAAARQRDAAKKAGESAREAAERARALALDHMLIADADTLAPYSSSLRYATRSEIMALGKDGESFGVHEHYNGELTATFYSVSVDKVREWTIARTGPATWVIAQARSGKRA